MYWVKAWLPVLGLLLGLSVVMAQFVWEDYALDYSITGEINADSWSARYCSDMKGIMPPETTCSGGKCICNVEYAGDGVKCAPKKVCQHIVYDDIHAARCLPFCKSGMRKQYTLKMRIVNRECDFSSSQKIQQCGNCFMALCDFENNLNPQVSSCGSEFYADVWPCYMKHFEKYCGNKLPICSAPSANIRASLVGILALCSMVLMFTVH